MPGGNAARFLQASSWCVLFQVLSAGVEGICADSRRHLVSRLSHALSDTGLYHNTNIWNEKDMARFESWLTGCLLLILLSGALGTQSGKLQIVADDFKDRGAVKIIFQFVERCDGRIVNATAADATDMVVFFGNSVVPFHASGELQPLDFSQFAKHIEISINGAQADSRQSFSHPLVDFVGGWVVVVFADLFQNDLSLSGHPRFFVEFHARDLQNKV
jgi:hypothetical protein